MFPAYFLIQGVCGFLAVGSAVGMARSSPSRVHTVRSTVLLLALATVVVGWPLERKVHNLREPRYDSVDEYLALPRGTPPAEVDEAREKVLEARVSFGLWHLASLALNLATVVLVAVGMALAAFLPARQPIPTLGKNGEAAQGEAKQSEPASESKGGV
jgi:hypothetical protein